MATKRMMTKKVTDDDNFVSLSSSAQALYLHLSMSADDDGFCNQISTSMFKAHASTQDLQALLEKRYVYQFENGVIVIKHWRMANALRKDRYTETVFKEELAQLELKDNGSYTRLPSGCRLVATDKTRQDKIRQDKIITNNNTTTFYEEHFGKLTTVKKEIVSGWLSDYGDAAVWDAMQTAAKAANVTNPLAYIGGILKNKSSKAAATQRSFRGEQEEDNVDIVL